MLITIPSQSLNSTKQGSLSLFFGDHSHTVVSLEHQGPLNLSKPPFQGIVTGLELEQLVFLKQVHSTKSMIITKEDAVHELPSFVHEGDALITNAAHIGIGVVTADCLPLIFFDTATSAISIAHAGWKGTINDIVFWTLHRMNTEYQTEPQNVHVWLGPSARACCYEVQPSFVEQLPRNPLTLKTVSAKNGNPYFDFPLYNILQLIELGVPQQNIHLEYHQCTICSPNFCSVRKHPNTKNRQITFACLS